MVISTGLAGITLRPARLPKAARLNVIPASTDFQMLLERSRYNHDTPPNIPATVLSTPRMIMACLIIRADSYKQFTAQIKMRIIGPLRVATLTSMCSLISLPTRKQSAENGTTKIPVRKMTSSKLAVSGTIH
jgi:hypothetical protein